MEKQYFTIKEFAKQAGISPQYVYKQLKTGKLSQYAETIDGKKMLKAEALAEYRQNKNKQKEPTTEQQLISILQDQLSAKDRQIEELQAIVKAEQSLRYSAEHRLSLLEGTVTDGTVKPAEEPTEAAAEASESRREPSDNRPEKKTVWGRIISTLRGR